MNWVAISGNPFFTVALPLILTFVFSTWFSTRAQNQRIDDLRKDMYRNFDTLSGEIVRRFDAVDRRFEAIERRLDRIEAKLDNYGERISRLEGPSLVRGG